MRHYRPYVLIFLLLFALASFAWLTGHPDAPIVDRAMGWPGIGIAAHWFRASYPIALPSSPIGSESTTIDAFPHGVRPEIWLDPGTQLREQARQQAGTTGEIRNATNAVVVERRGPWYLLASARQGRGWAYLPDYREPVLPIFGSGLIPVGPLPARSADPQRLASARALLGDAAEERKLGAYVLLTDLDDPVFWSRCESLVERSESLYEARYGVTPIEDPRETIVAFSRSESYRRFVASEGGTGSSGHALGGLIALETERRLREEVIATLGHEIAHLLNRRALGPALPLWLEEGIAGDFASQLVRPLVITAPGGWWASGPGAAPLLLREARSRGEAPSFAILATSSGEAALLDPASRALHVSAADLWIRFLVESETSAGFGSYLQGIVAGGPTDLEALERATGGDVAGLERAFWDWFSELDFF